MPHAKPGPTDREVHWYALGSLPGGVGALGFTYIVFYYNQVLGIPASLIGLGAALVSLFDAVTDPVVGAVSDRSRSRWGRRHGYLLWSAIPAGLVFYFIWAPPSGLELTALMGWLLMLHLAGRVTSTLYTVPYLALGAEVSADYEERTRIVTARNIYYHVGRATAGGLLLLVFLRSTDAHPNGQLNPEGYAAFGAFFAVVTTLALLASAWFTRSWISRLSTAPSMEGLAVRQLYGEFRQALRLRAFRALLFGSVSKHIGWGLSDALGLYMATYFWQVGTDILFLWGACMFAGLFTGLPFWRRMASRYDKKPICIIGDASYLVFYCSPFLFKVLGFWPEHDSAFYLPLYLLTTGFLSHFGIAASGAVTGSMLGDVTDLDELEGGRRREGVIFGAESFSWKALTGLGPLGAGIVVDLVGLSDGVPLDAIPESVVMGLGLAQGATMTLLFGLALFFISRYDLDRQRHAQVLAQLAAKSVG